MQAVEVLRLVSGQLQDLEAGMAQRWPWVRDEHGGVCLLDFLNAAMRAIALQRPDCCAVTEAIRLEPGTRQRIPVKGVHQSSRNATGFCGLVRNMGHDGKHPGSSIGAAQPDILAVWSEMEVPSASVQNFAYDRAQNGLVYYVCPPVTDRQDVWVEATYYCAPDTIVSPEQDLNMADDYIEPIQHHMLASILSGDNESGNASLAGMHMTQFQQLMGTKTQVDTAWPKAKAGL